MIGHMAGQDQKLLDCKMELDNLKEDVPKLQQFYLSCAPTDRPENVSPPQAPDLPQPVPTTQFPSEFPVSGPTDARPLSAQFEPLIPPPMQFAYTIPTSNRFEGFTEQDTDIYVVERDIDPPRPPKPAPRRKPAPAIPKPVPRPRPRVSRERPQKRPKVKTMGSSMVADQDYHQCARGLDAVCHAHSGEKAQQIQSRIQQETSEDDEYIVLAGGTNNVPRDYVIDIIRHVGNLIDHTRAIRPNAQIIVPQLLHRYNNAYWVTNNEKVNRVNCFLKHRCNKDPKMHFLPLDNITRDDLYDKLHLDYCGKDKYAEAVADLVFRLEQA